MHGSMDHQQLSLHQIVNQQAMNGNNYLSIDTESDRLWLDHFTEENDEKKSLKLES